MTRREARQLKKAARKNAVQTGARPSEKKYYYYENPAGIKIDPVYKRLNEATHLLIAGTTGAGKSVCLGGILRHIESNSTPASCKFILIDPKRTELKPFVVSHFAAGYTSESAEAVKLLDYVVNEIEKRFIILNNIGRRTWAGQRLIVVIDELADLMISPEKNQIKLKLQKILQIGRAAGVSVFAATQAPNRQIIPADLTLNFTDRVALRCVSPIESRQIVQIAGAEKLPKHGKAIYLNPDGISEINIPYVSDEDILQVTNYWRANPYKIMTARELEKIYNKAV